MSGVFSFDFTDATLHDDASSDISDEEPIIVTEDEVQVCHFHL